MLSVRGNLSNARLSDNEPLVRVDHENNTKYEGNIIGTNETMSIFTLFTSVFSYNDLRLFLGSNGKFPLSITELTLKSLWIISNI